MNNIRKFFLISFVLIVLVFCYLFYMSGLSDNGYRYITNRSDDVHIVKDRETVVGSTIVSSNSVSHYIIGLKLPVNYLICDNGAGYKIKVVNDKNFFILNKNNGEVLNYTSKKYFEDMLMHLGLEYKNLLDYSNFDKVWDRYSKYYKNVDYSNCKLDQSRTSQQ